MPQFSHMTSGFGLTSSSEMLFGHQYHLGVSVVEQIAQKRFLRCEGVLAGGATDP